MLQSKPAGGFGRSGLHRIKMSDQPSVKLTGFDELARACENAEVLFQPLASVAIATSIMAIHQEIAPYPPQPDRMRSGHLNTYVRGQGKYPASAFVADKQEPGGFRTKKISKASIKLTSQQMDKKFKTKVGLSDKAVVGELKNEAS